VKRKIPSSRNPSALEETEEGGYGERFQRKPGLVEPDQTPPEKPSSRGPKKIAKKKGKERGGREKS